MSAEVAKKRGRPKKVISDPVEVELAESATKATTRAKSTKTAAKGVKTTPATSAKAPVVKKGVSRPAEVSAASKPSTKSVATPATAATSTKTVEKPIVAKPTPTTPTTSKILEQVKQMESKKAAGSQELAKGNTVAASKARVEPTAEQVKETTRSQQHSIGKQSTGYPKLQPSMTAKPVPSQSQAKAIPPTNSPNPGSKPINKALPPSPPPSKSTTPPPANPPPAAAKPTPEPQPQPRVPIAELNSAVVSNIATRAGARPNAPGSQQLPKNYKPVARKVTMAIVALPIAIVTSYVLWQRLVLGEEKKLFPSIESKLAAAGGHPKTEQSTSSSGPDSSPAASQ